MTFCRVLRIDVQYLMGQSKLLSGKTQSKFEKCYFDLKDQVYWYIYKKVENNVIAEDIASDVFMKLLSNPNILEERDTNGLRAWLLTVARNSVIDHYRSSKVKKSVTVEPEIFEIFSSDDGEFLEELITNERSRTLIDAIEQLSNEEKELIYLRYRDNMPFEEIAQITGKTVGSVKMKVYRSIEKLKDLIDGEIL